MDMGMAAAAVLAFAPALLIMYAVLRKYTYPAAEQPFFSDPALFGLFAIGLVAGSSLFAGYTYFNGSWGSIAVAVPFALLSELVKFVILNMRRFSGKSDTIFYGFGFGLGTGCTLAFGMTFYLTSQADGMDAASWMIVIVYAFTQILLHSSTGTTIGEGSARKRVWEFFFQALLIGITVSLLMVPVFTSLTSGSAWYYVSYVSLAAALAVSAIYFMRTHFVKLPGVVRDVLSMEKKRA